MSALTAGLLAAALAAAASSEPPRERPRRGPIASRDEFLLAQPRLTLPAISPDPLGRGRTRVNVSGDWGNDFGLRLLRQGDAVATLFMVDGEHRSLAVEAAHGVGPRLTVHARVPVLWRGGGVMDGLIDAWHRLTGLPEGGRPLAPRDELRVVVAGAERRVSGWNQEGGGLGGVELGAHWAWPNEADPGGFTAAGVVRVQAPTAAAPFDGAGWQAAAQVVAAHGLGGGGDVYAGAGAVVAGDGEQDGIRYARLRPHGFLALEWRPGRPISLLAELSAAGRLVEGAPRFPGLHLILKMGAKLDLGTRWRIEGGFTEGLRHISNTTDFGVMLGLQRRF